MTIFEELDKFSLGKIDNQVLTEYILSHTDELSNLFSGMSVYAYAGILSSICLQTLHEAFLQTNSDSKPWEIGGKNAYKAIHYITESNQNRSLQYLLDKVGADINVVDISGNTALHIVCRMNLLDIVTTLLHFKPDLNIVNTLGYTPLAICVKMNHYKIADILLKRSPKIEYSYNDAHYDIKWSAETSPFIEIKNVFKKHIRSVRNKNKVEKYKTQTRKSDKESRELYNFYCNSFNNTVGVMGLLALARHYDIRVPKSQVKNFFRK
jgi:ankyrin repeat protein